MTKQEKLLFDICMLVGVPALPEPFEEASGRIWVDGIAKVLLRSGEPSFALVRNVWGGAPIITRMFDVESIAKIVSIHPYSYLKENEVPGTDNISSLRSFVQRVYNVDAGKVKSLTKPELVKLAFSYAIKAKSDAEEAARQEE